MSEITVILTAYRRPAVLCPQVEAIRAQTTPARAVWLWANEPDARMQAEIEALHLDRVVTCTENAFYHARFALALTAPTEYVAVFDDDTMPGRHWFAGCLQTIERTPGILGAAGVRLLQGDYQRRSLHGWHAPSEQAVEVDLVGHAWFLRTAWVRYLFAAPPVLGTNGEDIELAARAWRLGGVRSYCPPHPPGDRSVWGSLHGEEFGSDQVAASRRAAHLDERDRVVRAEIAAGWTLLYRRTDRDAGTGREEPHPGRWERPETEQLSLPTNNDLSNPEVQPELLDLVPQAADQVLEIGCGTGLLGAALKARQPARVHGIELNEGLAQAARGRLDEVWVGDVETLQSGFPAASFDCVLCDRLENLRGPDHLLRPARAWLVPAGRLIARVANTRHHRLVTALLEGAWAYEPLGALRRDQLRFFTRREIEKLFHRAGFAVVELRSVPGPGHEAWKRRGCPKEVTVGRLQVTGMAVEEVEEFYTSHYLVSAVPTPPPEYGLTSIVLVTHNEVAYTRACVDSIRMRTDEPYELIFVDNNSTDGTLDYLRSLPGVQVICNENNRGFPAAANQGIRAAAGKQVLLLNNDTVVTTGWLGRLLRALHGDPRIGLAGPCSNCVSGEQQVAVRYDGLEELDGFAWDWGKAHDQRLVDTDRLVGFCLLIRREVLDKIGPLDERFGVGCFEDDDFCLRALRAGYRAVIAQDAFVHHFGSRTFAGSRVDFASLLHKNQQLFQEKWAKEDQTRRSPPAPQPAAPAPPVGSYTLRAAPAGGLLLARQTVQLSLCMIVRDNARTLGACLESIRPWVDEMIVVDTGSTDETPKIAEELGARLFHFPWCDDFAAARNESLRHARGRWVFWMDSDDTIDAENGRKLRALVSQAADPSVLGYVIQVHCPGPPEEGRADVTVVDHVKLFRNLPPLRFEGRIHEQILPSIRRAAGEVAWTDLFVVHSGYDHSPEGQERKRQRDLRLLHLEHQERGEHPFTLFNLGMTYADVGRYPEAVDYLKRSIARSTPSESHLRKAYALLVYARAQLGEQEAAWVVCQEGLRLFPKDTELRFRKGILLHERGRLQEAAQVYQDLLQTADERHFTSVDEGIASFKARQNLAVVYQDLGDLARAEEQWWQVVQERPSYRAGWRGLGEVLLRQDKQTEAGVLVQRLLEDKRLRKEGLLLKGQVALARGDGSEARRELERAVAEYPDDPEAWQALCRFLFEQGELDEAEAALKELIRRSPRDGAAYHNLGTIYLQTGRATEAAEAYQESLRHRPYSPATEVQLSHALQACER